MCIRAKACGVDCGIPRELLSPFGQGFRSYVHSMASRQWWWGLPSCIQQEGWQVAGELSIAWYFKVCHLVFKPDYLSLQLPKPMTSTKFPQQYLLIPLMLNFPSHMIESSTQCMSKTSSCGGWCVFAEEDHSSEVVAQPFAQKTGRGECWWRWSWPD